MNELYSQRKKRLIAERNELLDKQIEAWKSDGSRILTDDNLDVLRSLASKNLANMENKQNLTPNERSQKTLIHQKLRNGVKDIIRMIDLGIMGPSSMWNPFCYDDRVDRLPYDVEVWKEDFSVSDIGKLVECLVSMFGDEYAVPLADAIRRGLEAKEGWNSSYEVDVPVIKRGKRTSL